MNEYLQKSKKAWDLCQIDTLNFIKVLLAFKFKKIMNEDVWSWKYDSFLEVFFIDYLSNTVIITKKGGKKVIKIGIDKFTWGYTYVLYTLKDKSYISNLPWPCFDRIFLTNDTLTFSWLLTLHI